MKLNKLFLSALALGALAVSCEKDELEALTSTVNANHGSALARDGALSQEIKALDARITAALMAEESARQAGDAELADLLAESVARLEDLLSAEEAARVLGDLDLSEALGLAIGQLSDAIASEEAARLSGDSDLSSTIADAIVSLNASIKAGDIKNTEELAAVRAVLSSAIASGDANAIATAQTALDGLAAIVDLNAAASELADDTINRNIGRIVNSINQSIIASGQNVIRVIGVSISKVEAALSRSIERERAARVANDNWLYNNLLGSVNALSIALDAEIAARTAGDDAAASELAAAIVSLSAAISEGDADVLQEARHETIYTVQRLIISLNVQIAGLQAEIDALETELNASLSAAISTLNAAIATGDSTTASNAASALLSSVQGLSDTSSATTGEITTLINALTARVDGLEGVSASYDASTGVLTITLANGSTVVSGDLRGSNGTDGEDGDDGVDGTNGANGTDGTNGAQGTQGTQGEQGTQGNTGATGAQGNTGGQGPSGSGAADVVDTIIATAGQGVTSGGVQTTVNDGSPSIVVGTASSSVQFVTETSTQPTLVNTTALVETIVTTYSVQINGVEDVPALIAPASTTSVTTLTPASSVAGTPVITTRDVANPAYVAPQDPVDTLSAFSAWAVIAADASAPNTQQTITEERTRTVIQNGDLDAVAPVGDLRETRVVANPGYVAPQDPTDTLSAWSAWSGTNPGFGGNLTRIENDETSTGDSSVQFFTRTYDFVTYNQGYSYQETRTRSIVINGVADAVAPVGDLTETRDVNVSENIVSTDARSEQVVNSNYEEAVTTTTATVNINTGGIFASLQWVEIEGNRITNGSTLELEAGTYALAYNSGTATTNTTITITEADVTAGSVTITVNILFNEVTKS